MAGMLSKRWTRRRVSAALRAFLPTEVHAFRLGPCRIEDPSCRLGIKGHVNPRIGHIISDLFSPMFLCVYRCIGSVRMIH